MRIGPASSLGRMYLTVSASRTKNTAYDIITNTT